MVKSRAVEFLPSQFSLPFYNTPSVPIISPRVTATSGLRVCMLDRQWMIELGRLSMSNSISESVDLSGGEHVVSCGLAEIAPTVTR